MKSRKDLIRMFRRSQAFISILLFTIISLFFWNFTGFNLSDIQLSHWGSSKVEGSWLWNSSIVILSISIFINSYYYISDNNRIKNKKIPYLLFSFISICLFIVGVFNVDYRIIHNVAAWLYFFCYPLFIFIFTYLNRANLKYKEWQSNLIISTSMIILPMIAINMFSGFAIPEIIHVILVIIWNIKINYND